MRIRKTNLKIKQTLTFSNEILHLQITDLSNISQTYRSVLLEVVELQVVTQVIELFVAVTFAKKVRYATRRPLKVLR